MKVYNNLAATQMKLLAYDSAINSCDKVLKLQPNNVKALFRKGQALESKKDSGEALVYYKVSFSLVFSRVRATLQVTLSVRRSVTLYLSGVFWPKSENNLFYKPFVTSTLHFRATNPLSYPTLYHLLLAEISDL